MGEYTRVCNGFNRVESTLLHQLDISFCQTRDTLVYISYRPYTVRETIPDLPPVERVGWVRLARHFARTLPAVHPFASYRISVL